jgi:hypothetical protein
MGTLQPSELLDSIFKKVGECVPGLGTVMP